MSNTESRQDLTGSGDQVPAPRWFTVVHAHDAHWDDRSEVVFIFTDGWMDVLRASCYDPKGVLLNSAGHFPLCTNLSLINDNELRITIDRDSVQNQITRDPSDDEILRISACLVLVLEELSGVEWCYTCVPM